MSFFSFLFQRLPLVTEFGALFFVQPSNTTKTSSNTNIQDGGHRSSPGFAPCQGSHFSFFFLFLLRFPCCLMFEECPSVLCFFVQREIPFQRAQHQNPRWRARLEHVQCRLERRTRHKLPYDPFSSRRNRFPQWAQATGLALVIAQASCLSACVMRGIEMFGVSFRGKTTISEGFPMSFRRCSDDLPTMFRRCSEDVPKGSRGVLGRRRLFGAFREKRGTSGKVRSAGGAPLPVQGHSSVGCLVLFPPKKFPAL